jgi:hypothetical protein
MGALIFFSASLGIAATVIAFMLRRSWLVVVGFVLVFPLMLYILFSPKWPLSAVALAGHLAAAVAVRYRHVGIAWMLFLPTPAAISYLSLALMGVTLRMHGF